MTNATTLITLCKNYIRSLHGGIILTGMRINTKPATPSIETHLDAVRWLSN